MGVKQRKGKGGDGKKSSADSGPPSTSKPTSTASTSNMLIAGFVVVSLVLVWSLVSPAGIAPSKQKSHTATKSKSRKAASTETLTSDNILQGSPEFWAERWAHTSEFPERLTCKDVYPDQCRQYGRAECARTPGWMVVHCSKTCEACDLRHPENRCKRSFLNVTDTPAYSPGDMNAMFEAVSKEPGVIVHSRDPWVVTWDQFMSEDEVDDLVNAPGLNFVRSTDTGAMDEETGSFKKIVSSHRTSQNAWCTGPCETHPASVTISDRIAAKVRIPKTHWEFFQVLRYEPGQYYGTHHDYIDSDGRRTDGRTPAPAGPRVLTFFLYLSDVAAGGATCFPYLTDVNGTKPICVAPKKGRALLWPSVLDSDPFEKEGRTEHNASAVVDGIKVAANAWVHLFNFWVPNKWGCTGIFDTLDDSNVDVKS
eukprot:m.68329 g.68329  ORF g.68329 m.68329 type:complete len:423 (+) comp23945_c2_seq1:50-1318(+)